VLYVEELVGSETVNTIPLATLDAFRDHGRPRPSLAEGLADADRVVARLGALGIDLAAVTERLQVDGVAAFAASYDALLAALEARRAARAGMGAAPVA
jgi:transaldolase